MIIQPDWNFMCVTPLLLQMSIFLSSSPAAAIPWSVFAHLVVFCCSFRESVTGICCIYPWVSYPQVICPFCCICPISQISTSSAAVYRPDIVIYWSYPRGIGFFCNLLRIWSCLIIGHQLYLVSFTNFRLHDEQTVNGLRKIAWSSVLRLVPMSPCPPCLHVPTNGKRQHPFVCCKRKKEAANFRLSAEKRKTEVCFPWSANDKR